MRGPEKKKVFITVKTYPTLSAKYNELVCTAGVTDKGKWIRLYPVPFRKLEWEKQYKKYQWIELECIKKKMILDLKVTTLQIGESPLKLRNL